MDWSQFFTIMSQLGIGAAFMLVVLFVGSAIVAAIIKGMRK